MERKKKAVLDTCKHTDKRNIGSGVKIVSAGNSVKHNCVHLSLSSQVLPLSEVFLKEYKSPGQISGPGDVTLITCTWLSDGEIDLHVCVNHVYVYVFAIYSR